MRPFTGLLAMAIVLGTLSCSKTPHHKHKHGHKGMNEKFLRKDLDVQKWARRFDDPQGSVYPHREAIVKSMGLSPGQIVADIGAGTGTLLPLLHRAVSPGGKIYAVDISPKFIEYLKERVQQEGLSSVVPRLGQATATGLEENSVDVLFICRAYHHFDHPQAMLEDFKKILRPGGKLFFVEYDKIPGVSRPWALRHVRLDRQGHIDEVSGAGFRYLKTFDIPMKETFMAAFSYPGTQDL